ncbi:MAG: right-handed parallel beta-helix repeat-containing protein [Candidatus Aquicultor sp.]
MLARSYCFKFARRFTSFLLVLLLLFEPTLSIAAPLQSSGASSKIVDDRFNQRNQSAPAQRTSPSTQTAGLFDRYSIKKFANTLFSAQSISGTQVGGTISQNTTWTASNSPYVVTSNITVNSGVKFTIEPGVVVKFNPQLKLTVNGTLLADGTESNKIVFTSIKDDYYAGDTNGDGTATVPAKGDWSQLYLGSGSTSSVLDNCIVKYAGYSAYYGAIYVASQSFTLTNNTIAMNSTYAVYTATNTTLIKSGNTATDNTRNGVYVANGTTSTNTVWQGTDLPYVVLSFAVGQNKLHTVAAGTVVKFDSGGSISVNGGFNASGTAEASTVFTSVKDDTYGGDTNNDASTTVPAKGDWSYVKFNDQSIDASSTISFSRIRYAGSSTGSIYLANAAASIANSVIEHNQYAGVYLTGNSQPSIIDNRITDNAYGIQAIDTATPSISRNTMQENTGTSDSSAIYLSNSAVAIITDNTLTANTYGVYMKGSSQATVSANAITNNTQYPIVMAESSMVSCLSNIVSGNMYDTILLSGTRT